MYQWWVTSESFGLWVLVSLSPGIAVADSSSVKVEAAASSVSSHPDFAWLLVVLGVLVVGIGLVAVSVWVFRGVGVS